MQTSQQRIALGLLGAPEVPNMVTLARLAEKHGFESVWVAETRLMRDALVPCAAILLGTEHIKVATGIINVYTRGAVLCAASFVSLAEISPERIIVGLGPGSPLVLQPQGFDFKKPVTRLREYVRVVRALLAGECVNLKGETITIDAVELESTVADAAFPIYLGVTGPRALELAGETADGVMLNAFLPTSYVTHARERIKHGAQTAGRDAQTVDIAGAVVVSMDQDTALAFARARKFIALYLSLFPNIAKETGLDDATLTAVQTTFKESGQDAAAALIGDDIVNSLTASGTPEQCAQRIGDYRDAGLSLPILFPLAPNTELVIRTLGSTHTKRDC